MEIVLADEMGFCFGVRRAVESMEHAGRQHGLVETLGAVVHNQQVVERLEALGVRRLSDLSEAQSRVVAITAHGAGPTVLGEARRRGLDVIDTTCPIVTKAQLAAKKLVDEGFSVVIYGDANHPEVRGILAWAGEKGCAARDWRDVPRPRGGYRKVGLLCQTTENIERFRDFVNGFLAAHLGRLSEVRIVNTLCNATTKAQDAALRLAQAVDLVLVIGGRNSANTKHLTELCREIGATTYHVETAEEIEPAWFTGVQRVGITAGASTPDWVIEEVVARVSGLGS